MDKRERAQRAKQEDALLNRVLAWIAGAVVLEALLLLLDRYYVNYRIKELPIQQALYQVMGVLAIVFPICFVLCAVWWFTSWRKEAITKRRCTRSYFNSCLSYRRAQAHF